MTKLHSRQRKSNHKAKRDGFAPSCAIPYVGECAFILPDDVNLARAINNSEAKPAVAESGCGHNMLAHNRYRLDLRSARHVAIRPFRAAHPAIRLVPSRAIWSGAAGSYGMAEIKRKGATVKSHPLNNAFEHGVAAWRLVTRSALSNFVIVRL